MTMYFKEAIKILYSVFCILYSVPDDRVQYIIITEDITKVDGTLQLTNTDGNFWVFTGGCGDVTDFQVGVWSNENDIIYDMS